MTKIAQIRLKHLHRVIRLLETSTVSNRKVNKERAIAILQRMIDKVRKPPNRAMTGYNLFIKEFIKQRDGGDLTTAAAAWKKQSDGTKKEWINRAKQIYDAQNADADT